MNYYFKNLCQYPSYNIIPNTHLYDNIKEEHEAGNSLMPHLYYSLYANNDFSDYDKLYTKSNIKDIPRALNPIEQFFHDNNCIIIRQCPNKTNTCDIYNYSCFMCSEASIILFTDSTPTNIVNCITNTDNHHRLCMKRTPDCNNKNKSVSLPVKHNDNEIDCILYKVKKCIYIVTNDYDEYSVYLNNYKYDNNDNKEDLLFKFPYAYDIIYPSGEVYYMNSVREMVNNNIFYFPPYAYSNNHMYNNNEQVDELPIIKLTIDLVIPSTVDLNAYNVTRIKTNKYYCILYLQAYLTANNPNKYKYTHHALEHNCFSRLVKLDINKENTLSIVSKNDFMTAWNNISFNDPFYLILNALLNINIPENILVDITDRIPSGFKVCDNTEVNNIIVDYIDKIGHKFGIYCAGGACLSMLNNTSIKDIDLFVIKDIDMELVKIHLINYLNDNTETWIINQTESKWLVNFSIKHKDTGICIDLQFILGKHASLYHIICGFDLSPCKIIYVNKKFLTIKNSRSDTPNKAYIHVAYLNNNTYRVKERLLKYINEKKYDIYMTTGLFSLANINEDKLRKLNNNNELMMTYNKKNKTNDIYFINSDKYILSQKLTGANIKLKVINDYHIPSIFLHVTEYIGYA